MKIVVKYNDSGVNGGRSSEAYENEVMEFESPDMDSLAVSLYSVFEYGGNWDDEVEDKEEIIGLFHNQYNGDIAKFAYEESNEANAVGGDRYVYFVSIDGKPILDGPEPVIAWHPGQEEYRDVGSKNSDGTIEYYHGNSPEEIEYQSSLACLKDKIKKEVEEKQSIDVKDFTLNYRVCYARKIDGEPVTPEKVKKVATEMGYGDRIVDGENDSANQKDPAEEMYDIFDKGLSDKPSEDDAE